MGLGKEILNVPPLDKVLYFYFPLGSANEIAGLRLLFYRFETVKRLKAHHSKAGRLSLPFQRS
jgi:hypothetical protein